MASYGWGQNHSVIDWLYAEGHRFDFHQAVKLLQDLAPQQPGNGRNGPAPDCVRFRSSLSSNFPASEIDQVRPPDPSSNGHGRPEMTVNFMGLAGAFGPLPPPYTELVERRSRAGDTAMQAFLDIFNHRLVWLMFQLRRRHRLGLENCPPGRDVLSPFLYSFVGMLGDGLQGRMSVPDRALLHYAGLLSMETRSAAGLQSLLSSYFEVPVRINPFSGGWEALSEEDQTAVGSRGRNNSLGVNTVLGPRVSDPHGRFEVELGPLTLAQFLDFLPTGSGHFSFRQLTRFYAGEESDVDLALVLRSDEVPAARLHPKQGSRLGWTSWLVSGQYPGADPSVRLTPRSLPGRLRELRIELFSAFLPEELAELSRRVTAREVPAGAVIVEEGRAADRLFIIVQGSVDLTRSDAQGKEMHLRNLSEGHSLGEWHTLVAQSYDFKAAAVEASRILELTAQDLEEVMQEHPRTRTDVIAFLQDCEQRRHEAN